jgi:hypothetical protein
VQLTSATVITGSLKKMSSLFSATLEPEPVQYILHLGNHTLSLNSYLGKKISFRYTGEIYCIHCGRKTKKSFQQGHCFPCYRRLLECGLCIIHPEKCRYYENICHPNDWAHTHCQQPHVVYLANSSGLKVGITRTQHFQTRWIDQGATQGLIIYTVQNRHQAGQLEVILKNFVSDKTNWQMMLKGDNQTLDLEKKRDEIFSCSQSAMADIFAKFSPEIQPIMGEKIIQIRYPVLKYPTQLIAHNLDKNPYVEGILQGIKGQYLLLDTGVLSIRKFGGYQIEFVQDMG